MSTREYKTWNIFFYYIRDFKKNLLQRVKCIKQIPRFDQNLSLVKGERPTGFVFANG
jgi:hypothetical protein